MFIKEPIAYIPKIRTWLNTYPPFQPYLVVPQDNFQDINRIHVGAFPEFATQGASMMQPIQITSTKTRDVGGNVSITRRFMTSIFALVPSRDDFTREDAINFNSDFVHWADEQSILGLVPKFGDYDTLNEELKIVGNFMWNLIENKGQGLAQYRWDLTITHFLFYEAQPL